MGSLSALKFRVRQSAVAIGLAQLICFVTPWLFFGASTARAALILCDDPSFGPNSAVCDTSTGLEWLRFTPFSQGLTPRQVLAQMGSGGKYAGFEFADRSQLVTLFTEVFGTPFLLHNNADLDLMATENFATLFGPTGQETILGQVLPILTGYFDVFPEFPGGASLMFVSYGPNAITNIGLAGATDIEIESLDFRPGLLEFGNFLVRVPEPSLSLFSVSLIGLAAVVLRRRRNRAPS